MDAAGKRYIYYGHQVQARSDSESVHSDLCKWPSSLASDKYRQDRAGSGISFFYKYMYFKTKEHNLVIGLEQQGRWGGGRGSGSGDSGGRWVLGFSLH